MVVVDGLILMVGKALTVTEVVAVLVHPLAAVSVTVYVPDAAVVADVIVGFCEVEV